jgi:hypothetical protein
MNEAVSYVCTFETCANDACRVRLWSKLKAESDPTRTWSARLDTEHATMRIRSRYAFGD